MQSSPELCDAPAISWGRRAYTHPGTNLGSGNRCGHDPEQFAADRLALPKVKGGFLPRVMAKLLERTVAVFNDPDLMFNFTHHTNKRNKDGRKRLARSESREGVGLVVHAIVSCLDLASLRVGTYRPDGSFRNYSALDLAERCSMVRVGNDPDNPGQLKRFPSSRFWRALNWIQDFGAITLFEQYEDKGNDVLRARPAIKTVSAKFLRRLGGITGGVWERARSKSYARTAKFLVKGTTLGIQTVQEAENLDSGLALDRISREVYGSKRKNAAPKGNKTVKVVMHREPQFDHDALHREYERQYAKLCDQLKTDLGRDLTGIERVRLPGKTQPHMRSFTVWLEAQNLQGT